MQYLPWLLLAFLALMFWRDVIARARTAVGDVATIGQRIHGAASSWVAACCIGIVIGTFVPTGIAWVREHGWTWPDVIPVIVPSEGKRQAIIVRESETDTPEFGILANNLRNGVNAKYLSDKGHTLTIHDDDDVDASGQPVAILAANKPYSGVELLIFDSGKLLSRAACPATASGVIEAIKRSGG